MPRRTNPFQKLTAAIMTAFYEPRFEVRESVLQRSQRTGVIRELDIRIVERDNRQNRMLVECRCHGRKQDVQWVDAVDGKARSLGFPKAIMVSASGFTESAQKEAQVRGIDTLELKEAEKADWCQWQWRVESFGIVIRCPPTIRGVFLGVKGHVDLQSAFPDKTTLDRVVIVDTRRYRKIRLSEWIQATVNNPALPERLSKVPGSSTMRFFRHTTPCDPDIFFYIEPSSALVPLTEVVLKIEYGSIQHSVPLKHFSVGGDRVLAGTAEVEGQTVNVVIREGADGRSSVTLERVDPNAEPPEIDE